MKSRGNCKNLFLWLLLFAAVLLTACGSGDGSRGLGIDGYIYVAEAIELPAGNLESFKERGGYLYYKCGNNVYRLPAEELMGGAGKRLSRENPVFLEMKETLLDYTLDSEGAVYYASVNMSWRGEILGATLTKRYPDGAIAYRLELAHENMDDIWDANNTLAVSGEGRAFLLTGDLLYIADTDGSLMAAISGDELGAEFSRGDGRLLEGEEGTVYYSPYDLSGKLYRIEGDAADLRQGMLRMRSLGMPAINGRLYGSPGGLLCAGSDGVLYRYRQGDSRWEELLRFGDSGLKGGPSQVLMLSEKVIVAHYEFLAESELYYLEKVNVGELPEKEVLTLATLFLTEELEEAVSEFNRTNGRYHISVEYYQGEEGTARLDARLVSPDPPDLIDLTNWDIMKYAEKGALEDLSPYLDRSVRLDRAVFLGNILEGYTIEGRLVCIPSSFWCVTVAGRTSQVGAEAGWTPEDVKDLVAMHPKEELFRNVNFTAMAREFFREQILEGYADWEAGECRFDGEEFRAFVRWMEGQTDELDSEEPVWDFMNTAVPENQLLAVEFGVMTLDGLMGCELLFGEEASMVGYPSPDGAALHGARAFNQMGIVADSRHKEGAWEFVEYFLAKDQGDLKYLSSRRDVLEERLAELMRPMYMRDEAGEALLDENGEVRVLLREGRLVDGEAFLYECMTQEEAEEIMDFVESVDFAPEGGRRDAVIDIVLEELTPYLKGQRTLEEATHILQNRVQNLMQEGL